MPELYDTAAPRKAANLSVNSDLLHKTRALNINLSATLERALKEELAKHEAAQWVEENLSAIKAIMNSLSNMDVLATNFGNFDGAVRCLP